MPNVNINVTLASEEDVFFAMMKWANSKGPFWFNLQRISLLAEDENKVVEIETEDGPIYTTAGTMLSIHDKIRKNANS